ncbi:MAG: SsrA-binding protein [Mycoplasmataceae bacterium]|nr:MAG: SsrA-binding protein [Mycoplasmataceae bacterium]
MNNKIITQAKKKLYDYKLIERYTAGIVLTGGEIKSLRDHQVSINEAYVLSQQQELYAININISTYKASKVKNDPRRKRKLLLKKKKLMNWLALSKLKIMS